MDFVVLMGEVFGIEYLMISASSEVVDTGLFLIIAEAILLKYLSSP